MIKIIRLIGTHRAVEESDDELLGAECVHDPFDAVPVGPLWYVRLERHVGELRLWCYVDGHVTALLAW